MRTDSLFIGFLGMGKLPYPLIGTSALATMIGMSILHLVGMGTLFMLTFALTIIAVFEVNKYLAAHPESDGREITIDDALGMWLSLMVSLSTAATVNLPYAIYIGAVLSWVSFLIFQTWKPSTIGWMRRTLKGGLGIILSAILSGLAGGFLSVVVLMGLGRIS